MGNILDEIFVNKPKRDKRKEKLKNLWAKARKYDWDYAKFKKEAKKLGL